MSRFLKEFEMNRWPARRRFINLACTVVAIVFVLSAHSDLHKRRNERQQEESRSIALIDRVNEAMLPFVENHILVQRIIATARSEMRRHPDRPLPAEIIEAANIQIKSSEALIESAEETFNEVEKQAQAKALPNKDLIDDSLQVGRDTSAQHNVKVKELKALIDGH
jgi:hypothetical protein